MMTRTIRPFNLLLILVTLLAAAFSAPPAVAQGNDIKIDVRREPGKPLPVPPPIEGTLPDLKEADDPTPKATPTPKPTATPDLELVQMHPPHQVIVGEVGNSSEYILTRLELDRMVDANLGEYDEHELIRRNIHPDVRRGLMQKREEERLSILRRWAIMKSIAMLARKEGIRVSDQEIDDYLEKIQVEFGQDAFDTEKSPIIKMAGITTEELRKDLRDALLVEKFVQKRIQQHFTEQKLEEIYKRNREAFREPAQIRSYQIFRAVSPSASRNEKRELRKDFEKVWKDARKVKNIEAFQKLSEKHSDPPYYEKRGSMGWVSLDAALHEDMRAALFRLEPGEVSRIVETPIGWHILTIAEKRPAKGMEFDDYAREMVKQLLIHEFKNEFGYDLMREAGFTVRFNSSGLRLVGEAYKK